MRRIAISGRRLVVVAILAISILLLVLADDWMANREMDQLTSAVLTSERSMKSGSANVETVVRESDFATLDRSLTTPSEYEAARQKVFTAVTEASADAAVQVRTAGAEVDDVAILPWHRDLRRARGAYQDHNHAWARYFGAVADSPSSSSNTGLTSDITATFMIADRRFHDALPWWDITGQEAQVRKIFNGK
jgi:ectoine hydroxylase-related dioxygenase (phytanoyl-CoA dioxygenase family)